jgi:hypothetical protein
VEKTPLSILLAGKEKLNIVYNKQGQIKVVYESGLVTDLPDELQGLNPDEIPEKLSKLHLKDEDEVMEGREEYDEEHEAKHSGDAIRNVRVLVTEENKYHPGSVAQLCLDSSGSYNKRLYISAIEKMLEKQFEHYCHHLFKLQQWAITYEDQLCTDMWIVEEEIFLHLKHLHYPFDPSDINVLECLQFQSFKSEFDPAAIVQRSIDNSNVYNRQNFIDTVETMTYNMFQDFCRHTFRLQEHVDFNSGGQLLAAAKPYLEAVRKKLEYFWELKYPYKRKSAADLF